MALSATSFMWAQSTSQSTSQEPQDQSQQSPDKHVNQAQNDTAPATDLGRTIKSAIQKDPNMAHSDVTVKVTDQEVRLSGTVPSQESKETAERIAQAHAEGRTVKNGLHINRNRQIPNTGPGAD